MFPGHAEQNGMLPETTPAELGLSVTRWTVEDGLPERTVTCLGQTHDGYLWCGTSSGLARFDGERFRVFDPVHTTALDEVQIRELRCDSKGRLWIRGSTGELIVYDNRQFRRISDADGLPLHQAGRLGQDLNVDFWVKGRSSDKFYRYRINRFEEINSSVPSSQIDRFIANPTGLEWAIRQNDRTLIHFTARGTERQSLPATGGQSETTFGRFFHLQNGALAVTSSHGVYALQDSVWQLLAPFTPPISGQALDGVEDWAGNLWVSFAGVGLVVCQPGGQTQLVSLPEASRSPFIMALMLDAEGNVWAAGDDGLYRIRHNTFHRQPGLAETRDQTADAVVEDSDGAIWLVYPKGLARLSSGRWDYVPKADAGGDLTTGAPSRNRGIYLGYVNYESGVQYVEKVTADCQRQWLVNVSGYPRVIVERRNGDIWTGTDTGVWRLQNGKFERVTITGETGDYQVYAIIEDRDSRVIVGAFRRGMFRQEQNGTWKQLTTKNDLGSPLIVSLYVDEENTLWAGTDRGLARWKNERWYAYSDAGGALPNWVRNVVSDKRGGLWLTSQFGVTRVERSALNMLADGKDAPLDCSRFDRSDGLPSVTCLMDQQTVLRSSDGGIWVMTAKGATVADPANWAQRRDRRSAPQVNVETMLVNDKPVFGPGKPSGESDSTRIVVPPGADRLEFGYAAINLTASGKCRFRYRLDGFDKEWVDAGDHRSVIYHYLSPGDYRFQVTAANSYGLWNTTGDIVMFTIQPQWWQTLWFRIGAGVFVLGVLWTIRSLKLRQLHRERVRREEFSRRLIRSQEDERKRIAAELHDSLGQNLLIAKNQLFLVQEMSKKTNASIQPKLEQVAESVGAALDEARAISHQLRPFQLERLGLTKAIRAMVRQTSESTKLPIEERIESVDALLPSESEVMIYRIVQEALSNIVKHADASRVQIIIERRDQQIWMLVQDDGRGFDAETILSAENAMRGLGLTGFEERARMLGGQFHCQSSPRQGTMLTFEIPIHETKSGDAKN